MFRNLKTKQATTAFLERKQTQAHTFIKKRCKFSILFFPFRRQLCKCKSMCEIQIFRQTQIAYDLRSNMQIAALFFQQ